MKWAMPATLDRVGDVDVVLVCVRYEQLADVPARVGGGAAPVVVLTPMMPRDHARLAEALPGRILAGMPSVTAYCNEAGAIRYWIPRAATTLVEQGNPSGAELELVKRLRRAGISARVERGVLARNVATTVSFVSLGMAIDVGGTIDAVLGDDALLALALRAVEQGRDLGRRVGKPAAWSNLLLRFARPLALKLAVQMARARSPEAAAYVEQHFGRKLHAQNVAMAQAMVDLAAEKGMPRDALEELLGRLVGKPPLAGARR